MRSVLGKMNETRYGNDTFGNATDFIVPYAGSDLDFSETDEYEDYAYDGNASYELPLTEVVPVGMIYGLTLLLGVIGNSLVIIAIARYKRMRNITNIFLLSLATADLILVIVCVPIKCIRFFTFTWTVGWFLCKFVHYIQNVSMICSVITLTVMSAERYIAIIYPLKAKSLCTWSHAITMVIIVWLLSFVLAVPVLFGQSMVKVGRYKDYFWCVKEWSAKMHIVYELYMFVLLFIMPISVMGVAYRGICKELWNVMSRRAVLRCARYSDTCKRPLTDVVGPSGRNEIVKRKPMSSEDDMTRKQVVYMLVVIVTLFAFCWGPILINNVLVAFNVLDEMHFGSLKPIRQAFFLMSYFNSCINPVVYGFMSKNFRQAFRRTLCSCTIKDDFEMRRTQWSTKTKTNATVLMTSESNSNRSRQNSKTFEMLESKGN